MRDELKKLLAQEIGRGAIDWNDLARTVLVELANSGDADLPSEDQVACVVAELSNGVLSSAEDEAIARGVSDLFRPVIAAQRARITELEAATKKPGAFGEGLVERLAKHLDPHDSQSSTGIARDAVEFVIAELAAMPVEMPTANELLVMWFDNKDEGRGGWIGNAMRLQTKLTASLAPILAAKDATIERQRKRIEELEIEWTSLNAQVVPLRTDVDKFCKQIESLEKRLAETPVDATGKTPGRVLYDELWAQLRSENEEMMRMEAGAKAVLRAFGGAEVLRRVRERIAGLNGDRTDPWIMKPDVLSIIDELTKTNEPHR